MNTNDTQLAALQSYFQLMNMNGAARVYRAAQELGIHDALRNGAASAAEVALMLVFTGMRNARSTALASVALRRRRC